MRSSVKSVPVASQQLSLNVAIESQISAAAGQIVTMTQWAEGLMQATDADLPRFFGMAQAVLDSQKDALGGIMSAVKREAQRRIVARGGEHKGEILDKEWEVKLEEQFAPYTFNLELLRQAAALLPDDEAGKVLKRIPPLTVTCKGCGAVIVIEPGFDEPGLAVSINTIIKRYPGSDVSKLLEQAMNHDRLESKVIIRPRKTTVKNVTRTVSEA